MTRAIRNTALMTSDARRILVAQGLRAATYGLGSVLLGSTLDARGWSTSEVGFLLTTVVTGTALLSFLVGRFGDRFGRRRSYAWLFAGLGGAGVVLAVAPWPLALVVVGLTGTLSTDVIESGPFTSLEQPMLAATTAGHDRVRLFGRYNAVAAIAGSVGALAAGLPHALRSTWPAVPTEVRWFALFVPVGITGFLFARALSEGVETGRASGRNPLGPSRRRVQGMAALFGLDSFGGGFVVQSFVAFWFSSRLGASPATLGVVFFFVGLLQAGSFLAAPRLARRFGLLTTMVATHLPSNLLLAAIPLAPNLPIAVALLMGRHALSQMDVPTRQAYVMALVEPGERTAAAAYTNTARYLGRPFGPILAGVSQRIAAGMPFFLAGGIKAVYDLSLWFSFRRVPPDGMSDPIDPV